MNTSYTNKEALLSAASHNAVSNQWHLSSILLALIMLTGSAVLISLSLTHPDAARETLYMALLTVGILLFIFSVYLLGRKSRRMVYSPTGSPLQKQTFYFDRPDMPILHRALEGDFSAAAPSKATSHGSIRLELVRSTDGRFAGAQLFSYESYLYTPVTPAYYFTEEEAEAWNHYAKQIEKS